MGGHSQELEGPDFQQGVAVDELAEGGMLQGRVGDEAVLLIRKGGRFFAVGARCSHYGGPLGEGALVGMEIRCPWHHAAFDITTGEATRAPALNPIGCWNVELRAGKVYVTSRKGQPKVSPASSSVSKVVIIGGGAAGNAAAEMLRRQGYSHDIVMVTADEHLPYDRPNLSKDYLAGMAPEEWIPLRSADFYREHNITVKLNDAVTSLDPVAKRIALTSGETISFDACLLATGSVPRRLPVPGADLEHVHYLRSLNDSRAIIQRAQGAKSAIVVGSGFIGLEVAASLKARGLEVTIVSTDDLPMQRILGTPLGQFLLDLYRSRGITYHGGKTIQAIEKDRVYLHDGTTVRGDLVIIGIGVTPAVELARSAKLRGSGDVEVNAFLETSAPGIFAAGDIARFPDFRTGQGIRIEHWVTAERQGQTAALNIMGKKTPFRAAPFFWSQHFDTVLSYVGHAVTWDTMHVSGDLEKRDATVAYLYQSKVAALLTVGRDKISLAAEEAMEADDQDALRRIAGLK